MCFINSTNGWVQSASMDIYKTITRKREETQVKGVMHARTPGKKASLDVLYSPFTVTVSRHHPHRGNLRHKWRVRTHPLQWEGINLLCIYRRLLKELHSLWIRLNVSEESLDEDYKIIFNLKRPGPFFISSPLCRVCLLYSLCPMRRIKLSVHSVPLKRREEKNRGRWEPQIPFLFIS